MKKSKKVTQTRKKRKFRFGFIATIFSLAALILGVIFAIQVLGMNILPLRLSIPIILIVLCLTLILFICINFLRKKGFFRFFCGFLAFVLAVGFGLGNYYIIKTNAMFDAVTNLSDQMTNTVSVVVMNGSGYSSLSDLKGKDVGVVSSGDSQAVSESLSDISSNGVSINQVEYDNYVDEAAALYNGEIDAMILNEAYRGIIQEYEDFTNIGTSTTVVHKTTFYTKRTHVLTESSDAVNVVSEPFTVLISGNDSYGSLNETSRSDVNMLVTVNPNTHTVLMTSIPRDYYLPLACSADSSDCPDGQYDKLTHSGLYGVDTTEQTIEEAFDVTINYNVRVNFSSLVNLVDAIGGIDVEVEEGLEVDTFYANGTEGVHAGTNHLDGERALAFARERKAYTDGDLQRTKNQQQVLQQIVKKIASPSMIINFGSFVDALSGAFETNMSSDDMLSLIRYEFTFFPNWTFEQYSVVSYQDTLLCASLGDYASVSVGNKQSMAIAKKKIDAVLNGDSATTIDDTIDENSYTPYLDEDSSSDDSSNDTIVDDSSNTNSEPVYYDDSTSSDETNYDDGSYSDGSEYYDPGVSDDAYYNDTEEYGY